MKQFQCDCGGSIKEVAPDEVLHACASKYATATSYYDGVDRPLTYKRVKINPELTNGEERYRWFIDWQ